MRSRSILGSGGLLILPLLAVIATACGDDTTETAILLTVKSAMGVPDQMDKITLEVIDSETGGQVGNDIRVPPNAGAAGQGDRRKVWIVAVVANRPQNYTQGVDLVVRAFKGGVDVGSTGAHKMFKRNTVVRHTVNLDLGGTVPLALIFDPAEDAVDVDVNAPVVIGFNEPMKAGPAGLTGAFELNAEGSTSVVPGAVSLNQDRTEFSFQPDTALQSGTTYEATLHALNDSDQAYLENDVGLPLARSYSWAFTTGSFLSIASHIPDDGATGVAQDQVVSVTFDRAMVEGTIDGNLKLSDDQGSVSGTASYNAGSMTASFTPAGPLRELVEHTAIVTGGSGGVEAVDGKRLAQDAVFTFTTASTAPQVLSTDPADDAIDVPPNAEISVTFDESMDASSFTDAFTVEQNAVTTVTGSVSYDDETFTATFRPDTLYDVAATVQVTLSGSVTDASGIVLGSDHVFDFTVGDGPGVVSTDPTNGAVDVSLGATVSAQFSMDMNPASINSGTFQLSCGTAVTGVVSYEAGTRTASFKASGSLPEFRECEAVLTTGVQGSSGVPLLAEFRWSFTTAGSPPVVVKITPDDRAFEVSTTARTVSIEFSEPLDPVKVTANNIRVSDRADSIGGAPVWVGGAKNEVTMTFPGDLEPGRLYIVEIGLGVTDLAGLSMAAPFYAIFWTRVEPGIAYTLPENMSTDVPTSSKIFVGFMTPMDPATFALTTNLDSAETVTVLREDYLLESGSLLYMANARALMFDPSSNLAPLTRYTVVLDGTGFNGAGITDDEGTLTGKLDSFTFVTGSGVDSTPPTVVGTDPEDAAGDVHPDTAVMVQFSEPMEPLTIAANNISLAPSGGGAAIAATIRYIGDNQAMILPDDPLETGTSYVLSVSDGVRDASGNRMLSGTSVTFTTEAVDDQPPALVATMPSSGAQDVPTNQYVALMFDEPVDASSVVVTALAGTSEVTGSVRIAMENRVVLFVPDTGWPASKFVTVFIAPGLADLDGNATEEETSACYFDVGTADDATGPKIASSFPVHGSVEIGASPLIVLNLSEQLDLTSFDQFEISVAERNSGNHVAYYVVYDPAGPRFDIFLLESLEAAKAYDVTIPSQARDLSGNPIQVGPGLNSIGFSVDSVKPRVIDTVPPLGGVTSPGSVLVARFDEAIDPELFDLIAFSVRPQGGADEDTIPGAVSYLEATRTALLQPGVSLAPGNYEALLRSGRVMDLAGNPLENNVTDGYQWSFQVQSGGLWIVNVDPGPGELLDIGEFEKPVSVVFNKPINQSTLAGNFSVETELGAQVAGTVNYLAGQLTAIFTPDDEWRSGETYLVRLETGLKADDGDSLNSPYTSDFSTVTIIFYDDLEHGQDGWSQGLSTLNTWKLLQEPGGDDNHFWATRGKDSTSKKYERSCEMLELPFDERVKLISPEIDVPAGIKTVVLLFNHRYQVQPVDFAELLVDKTGLLFPRSVLPPFNGDNNKYEIIGVDLSSALGTADGDAAVSFKMVFELTVDGQRPRQGQCDPTGLGWHVDDLIIYGY